MAEAPRKHVTFLIQNGKRNYVYLGKDTCVSKLCHHKQTQLIRGNLEQDHNTNNHKNKLPLKNAIRARKVEVRLITKPADSQMRVI